MRRRRIALAAAGALGLLAPASALGLRPGTAPPTAVGVAQREFHLTPYRRTVPAGAVKFNIRNFGEDTHNLVVRGPRGFTAVGPDVDSGQNATWTVKLRRPGSYTLLCTRANHLRLGMKTKLVVAAPSKR